MVNTPPTKKWHKWFYRISFFIVGMGAIILTCLQFKGDEEKSKRIYEDFANVISNEMLLRQGIDEAKINTTSELKIVINNQSVQSNSVIIITKQAERSFKIAVINVGKATAQTVSMIFGAPLHQTNVLVSGGWYYAGVNLNYDGFSISMRTNIWNHWDVRGSESDSIPTHLVLMSPTLTILTNYNETNFPAEISVFGANFSRQTFPVTFQIEN